MLLTLLHSFPPCGALIAHNQFIENATADATNIIEEHKQQIQKNKLISISIIIGKA